jgi:taurine--2-oxoglutarate transaminase
MEPDAGTNGIVAPDSYWPRLRRETRDRGTLLIADEVMSAFGRCGEWFAWQRYGEEGRPDIMSLAKGLTAAHLPLGAVVVCREIAERLENEMLSTGLTYCGHPLACAVGLAAIEAYEDENLIDRSRAMGASLYNELRSMQERVDVIGDVRGGHGLFAIVELVRDRETKEPVSPWPESHPSLTAFVDRAREEGISFAIRGNLIVLAPPLVIEEKDLMGALVVMERLLKEMEWS